ncbi:MAG: AzlC family ABC transporter permease, partial [Oscillospiraceae bacterium]|nr:AzlC family ABC transporter permease [Oscillospiraceae bacterium]
GMLMQAQGYGAAWAAAMSAVAYCGSMQFAAIPLLAAGFDPLGAFLMSLMVNARHLFYGIAMLDKYKNSGRLRFFLIFTLCDETFSLVSALDAPEGINRRLFYFWISLLDYLYWVGGSLLGGLLGSMELFNTEGLDFALTALFIVLFIEQIKEKEGRASGLIGALGALLALLVFGADNMVIPAMLLILAALLLLRRFLCRG